MKRLESRRQVGDDHLDEGVLRDLLLRHEELLKLYLDSGHEVVVVRDALTPTCYEQFEKEFYHYLKYVYCVLIVGVSFYCSVRAGFDAIATVEYKVCNVMKAGVSRTTMLHEEPGKRVKLGSGGVDHDVGIAAALHEGDEAKAVKIATKVAVAKTEFRDKLSSTDSLYNMSVGVGSRHGVGEADYRYQTTMDDSSRSPGWVATRVFSSDEYDREFGDEFSDDSSFSNSGSLTHEEVHAEIDNWLEEAGGQEDVFSGGQLEAKANGPKEDDHGDEADVEDSDAAEEFHHCPDKELKVCC